MTDKLEKKIIELIDDYLRHGIRFDSHGLLCDHNIENFKQLCDAIENSGDSGRAEISQSISEAIQNVAGSIEIIANDPTFLTDLIHAIKQAGKHDADNSKFHDPGV